MNIITIRTIMSSELNKILLENLTVVKESLKRSVERRNISDNLSLIPRLVCVGKTKPAATIEACYGAGQRHFGENYVAEFVDKSHGLQLVCPDIKWHFIGHLQANKVSKLLGCPNLFMLETIHSAKLADKVNTSWPKSDMNTGSPLNIMVQVNTSNESQKSGVPVEETCDLVHHVLHNCKNLHFSGLMTIGSFSHDYSLGPNPDFLALLKCKKDVMERFSLTSDEVEVSMGMSNDFEQAIEMGSTNVRIGSTIFGAREYAKPPSS